MGFQRPLSLALLVASAVTLVASCAPAQGGELPAAGARSVTVGTVRASTGSITVSTDYAGSIQSKEQVNVVPLTAGRVDKIYVDIGSEVRQGQLIAELSHDVLDAQLQQTQAGLRAAQSRLAALRTGSKPEEIAIAASQVSSAKTKLDSMLSGARAEQIAIGQAQVDSARARLDQLLNPTASDVQAAQSTVTSAQAALDISKTRLDQLKNPSATDVGAAKAAVSAADAALLTAQVKLDTLKNPTPSDVSAAYSTLISAQGTLDARRNTLNSLTSSLGRQPTYTDTTKAQSDVAVAQSSVVAAQAKVDALQSPLPNDLNTATANIASAQAALDSAKAKYDQLLKPSANDVAIAEANVAAAQATLDASQAKLNALKNPNPADVAAARATVAQAEQNLVILKIPSTFDVQLQKDAVAQAEQALALRNKPYTAQDMEAAQAAVDQAQAQVNLVKQQIEDTKVNAPFDGFVTQRFLSPGSLASSQTPVASLVSKDMLVVLRIEEARIGSLREGQPVALTSPALPGQTVQGRVTLIAPGGDDRRHTFAVQVVPVAATAGLKPGMSAQVNIATSRQNVVLVPKEALLLRDDQSVLFVVRDGKAQLRKVEVGLLDDKSAEIRGGLQVGEDLVVSGQSLLNDGDSVTVEQPRTRPSGGRSG